MKCTLYNKKTKVLDFELTSANEIVEVYTVYNIKGLYKNKVYHY